MNTTLTPTVASLAFAGVAGALGLAISPVGGASALAGVAPTLTAASTAPSRDGRPLSWSGLGQGANGASVGPFPWTAARFAASGVFGGNASLLVQTSPDGVNWNSVAAIPSAGGAGVALPSASGGSWGGVRIESFPGGVLVSATPDAPPAYLRVAVAGGDGSTSIAVTGTLSVAGAA